ncbi:hypothetical protein ACJX0J_006670, partial [Zea mays]
LKNNLFWGLKFRLHFLRIAQRYYKCSLVNANIDLYNDQLTHFLIQIMWAILEVVGSICILSLGRSNWSHYFRRKLKICLWSDLTVTFLKNLGGLPSYLGGNNYGNMFLSDGPQNKHNVMLLHMLFFIIILATLVNHTSSMDSLGAINFSLLNFFFSYTK